MLSPRALRSLFVSLWVVVGLMAATLTVIYLKLIAPAPPLAVGKPIPHFALSAQSGRSFHTTDYKGRPLFLAFVPDLSPDTVAEARSLKGSMERFEEAGGKVFLIVDAPAADALALHTREALPFPILLDPGRTVARRFSVQDDKRDTLVVDPKGIVAYHIRAVDPARHGEQVVDISRCCLDEVQAARSDGVGKPVHDLSLPRADTAAMTPILADRTQKATVVLFLSVRCPCSNAYNARINALARDYAARGVRFVAVYSSVDETAAQVAAHAKEHGFDFPVLHDEKLLGADHFHATVTPQAFLIDAKGTLVYAGRIDNKREEAKVSVHSLRDALDATLASTPVPASTPSFGCSIPRTKG